MKKHLRTTVIILFIAATAAAFFIGFSAGGRTKAGSAASTGPSHIPPGAGVEQVWTCSMHPQVRLPSPGQCPICFMDLVPLAAPSGAGDAGGAAAGQLVLSDNARRLAGIATTAAMRRGVSARIRMNGKVAVDETRTGTVAARVAGRIDRLYADATGIRVARGDHFASLYSPELLALQQELISSSAALAAAAADTAGIAVSLARQAFDAAKEKLRLLGFSQQELDDILSRKKPSDHMTVRTDQSGVVLERLASEGSYVEAGAPLFRIADLGTVWIILDAYELDLAWLRLGQKAQFTVRAYPGETFTGTVGFIDPFVDPMSRTVRVRLSAGNRDGRLNPDMLVEATVSAAVSKSGKVKDGGLKGKWISPMHPEIIKDGPGTCDICGMPLVPAESLGYVTSGFENVDPLVVPATAPLFTGTRSVVYVETGSDSSGTRYEGREVVLGPRVGDFYVVKSGIAEGELVVVNGAFRIDSELQIRARPSMMNPPGAAAVPPAHAQHAAGKGELAPVPDIPAAGVSDAFRAGFEPVYDAYFAIAAALAADDLDKAKSGFRALEKARSAVAPDPSAAPQWKSISARLKEGLSHTAHIENLADSRALFEKVSTAVISAIQERRRAAWRSAPWRSATRALTGCRQERPSQIPISGHRCSGAGKFGRHSNRSKGRLLYRMEFSCVTLSFYGRGCARPAQQVPLPSLRSSTGGRGGTWTPLKPCYWYGENHPKLRLRSAGGVEAGGKVSAPTF